MYQQGGTVFFSQPQGAQFQQGGFQYVHTGQGNVMLVNPKAQKKANQHGGTPFMYEKGGTVFFDTKQQKKELAASPPKGAPLIAASGEEKAKMQLDSSVDIHDEDGAKCSVTCKSKKIHLMLGKKAPQPTKREVKDIRCYDDSTHIHFVCEGAPGWHITLRAGDYFDIKRELLGMKRSCGMG